MNVPVFKSLGKPVYWCGLPRTLFFMFIIVTVGAFLIFRTLYITIPITLLYFTFRLLVREDRRIFAILRESMKIKGHYFPD